MISPGHLPVGQTEKERSLTGISLMGCSRRCPFHGQRQTLPQLFASAVRERGLRSLPRHSGGDERPGPAARPLFRGSAPPPPAPGTRLPAPLLPPGLSCSEPSVLPAAELGRRWVAPTLGLLPEKQRPRMINILFQKIFSCLFKCSPQPFNWPLACNIQPRSVPAEGSIML